MTRHECITRYDYHVMRWMACHSHEDIREMLVPIILGIIHQSLQHALDCFVEPFHHSIRFWIVGNGPSLFDVKELA